MNSVAILKTAAAAYHLPIRLKGLLVLQSARRPVGLEKMLYVDDVTLRWAARRYLSYPIGPLSHALCQSDKEVQSHREDT